MDYSDVKPDGKVTFDIPRSLYLSGTNHDHNQVCKGFSLCVDVLICLDNDLIFKIMLGCHSFITE